MARLQRSFAALSLFAVVVLSGCIGRVREPEVNLAGVKVGGIGLRGGTVIAQLEIRNPNDFDLETQSISYDLKVSDRSTGNQPGWIELAKGVYPETIKVDDHGRTIVEIPIEFTYAGAAGAIRSILDRGTFNYQLNGIVNLKEPLARQLPYKHAGNISLQGIR